MHPPKKTVLTTGEVAKICNVAPRTVSKWFDAGQLRGYRIPGSKDRRIPVDQLVRFMRAHGIPLNGLDAGRTRVLVIESDAVLAQTVQAALTRDGFEAVAVSTGLEAGAAAVELRPHVVVLDVGDADVSPSQVVRFFRSSATLSPPKLVATGAAGAQLQGVLQIGFDGFLCKPFEVRELIRLLESHAPQRRVPQLV